MLLSAAGFRESSYPLGPEHKAAISLTHFSCLVEHMKRPKDNEADSFGIAVTMRGKHNCTHQPGCHWKHITQWKRALAQTRPSFLPLSSQRDSPNGTSNGLAGAQRLGQAVTESLSVPLTDTHTCSKTRRISYKQLVKNLSTRNLNILCFDLRYTCKTKRVCVFRGVWLVVFGPKCLHTSSLISSLISRYGFGHPCHIPLATQHHHKHRIIVGIEGRVPSRLCFSDPFHCTL